MQCAFWAAGGEGNSGIASTWKRSCRVAKAPIINSCLAVRAVNEAHILPQASPTVSHPSIYSPPGAQVPTLALSLCPQLIKPLSARAVLPYKHTPAE